MGYLWQDSFHQSMPYHDKHAPLRPETTEDYSAAFDELTNRTDIYYERGGLHYETVDGESRLSGMVIGDKDFDDFMEIKMLSDMREAGKTTAFTKAEWKKEMMHDHFNFDKNGRPKDADSIEHRQKKRKKFKQMWRERERNKFQEIADDIADKASESPDTPIDLIEQEVLTRFVKRVYADNKKSGDMITIEYTEDSESLGFRELPWQEKPNLGLQDPYVEVFGFRQKFGDTYMNELTCSPFDAIGPIGC